MARPHLSPADKKSYLLAIRLTDKEREALHAQATAAGVTLTDLVRRYLPLDQVA
jgi:hypothetical protein